MPYNACIFLVKSFLTSLFIILTLVACTSGDKDKSTKDTLSDADGEGIVDSPITELRKYVDLPADSFYIKYSNTTAKIYGVRDGDEFIFEGDIKFPVFEDFLLEREVFMKRDKSQKNKEAYEARVRQKYIFGVGNAANLWPVNGGIIEVPYVINRSFEDSSRVKTAMDYWERSGFVKFKPFIEGNNVVEFISSEQTRSNIGKKTGYQSVQVESDKEAGNIAHEIGHLLGLFHEQCRSDRTKYISISCEDDKNYKFAKLITNDAEDVGEYNLYSIMHYSVDDCMTCLVKNLPPNIPGQRDSVTLGDFFAIKILYKLKK